MRKKVNGQFILCIALLSLSPVHVRGQAVAEAPRPVSIIPIAAPTSQPAANVFNYSTDMAQALKNYSDTLTNPDRAYGAEIRTASSTFSYQPYQGYDSSYYKDRFWESRYNYRYSMNTYQEGNFVRPYRSYSSIVFDYRKYYPHRQSFMAPLRPYSYPTFSTTYPNYNRFSYTQSANKPAGYGYLQPNTTTYSYQPEQLQYRDTAQSPPP